ncbi:MAG: hypothetical protein ACXAC8_07260 [Candidatus Hodarchaeales archaeon]|jgi:cytoskeletal protein CcmA (bactofilin family)
MSRKEIDDLKTLIKALDIRHRNEEISSEEYEKLKAKYNIRLEEEVNLAKENSYLKNLSYISISGSGKVTDSYISISGSGRVDGWRNGSISISGSGKISDDEIKVSGSASLPGNLKTRSLKASGSIKANGSVETDFLFCSGSIKIVGPLTVHDKLSLSGSGKFEDSIKARSIELSGSLKVDGGVDCVQAELNGSYKIAKNIKCEENFTSSLGSRCTIGGDLLCGGNVVIEKDKHSGRLLVEQIIAQGDVHLEGVTAKYVSGKKVILGPDCNIEKVEEKN